MSSSDLSRLTRIGQSLRRMWRAHLMFLALMGGAWLLLVGLEGSRSTSRAERLAINDMVKRAFGEGDKALVTAADRDAWRHARAVTTGLSWGTHTLPEQPVLLVTVDEAWRETLTNSLKRLDLVPVTDDTSTLALATLRVDVTRADSPRLAVDLTLTPRLFDGDPRHGEAKQIAGPWWAVWPPLIAVLLALLYRQVVLALGAAVWVGAALAHGFNPIDATVVALRDHVGGAFTSEFKLYVLAFTLALIGMVNVTGRSGGNQGLVDAMARWARSARSTRVVTALMGLVVFFDDYANALIVGSSARSLTDRMRISREKLAYLVDSTAAPVAGLALISTWVGYEVGLFDSLATELGFQQSGFEIFLAILPSRFYCLFALAFVFTGALSGRDFGPMLAAERRAHTLGQLTRPDAQISEDPAALEYAEPARWYNAGLPILTIVIAVIVGMASSGSGALVAGGKPAADLTTWAGWRDVFSAAESAKVLFWASILGSVVAVVLAVIQRLLTLRDALWIWFSGMRWMLLPLTILLLAWSMQSVTRDLGTSYYLISILEPILSPMVLPLVVFLAAAAVAFATGTSWGTMGILLPALVPFAWTITNDLPLTLLCMGAILDGAIFGDHCSPISDTTVMSSIASGCDHIDHVRTQLPYAMSTMIIAGLLGYILHPLGLPLVLVYVLGLVAIMTVFAVLGRAVDA